MYKNIQATQLAKGDNELCTLIGYLAGYSFIFRRQKNIRSLEE